MNTKEFENHVMAIPTAVLFEIHKSVDKVDYGIGTVTIHGVSVKVKWNAEGECWKKNVRMNKYDL